MANGNAPATIRTADEGNFYESALYKLLYEAFPQYRTRQDILDIPAICDAFPKKKGDKAGMSHEGFYKWLRSGRISVEGARKLIELSNGTLTTEKLFPFVLG